MNDTSLTSFFDIYPDIKKYFEIKKISSIQDINEALLDEFFYEYNVNPLAQIKILKTFKELNAPNIINDEIQPNSTSSEVYYNKADDFNQEPNLDIKTTSQYLPKETLHDPFNPTSIDKLNLSPRATNALIKNNIRTTSEMIDLTDVEIYNMRNVGKKTLEEILSAIKELKPSQQKHPIERLFIDEVLFFNKEKVSMLTKYYWKNYHDLQIIYIIEFIKSNFDSKNNPFIHNPKKLLTYEDFVMIYEKLFEYILVNLQEKSPSQQIYKESYLDMHTNKEIFSLNELMREYYNAS